MAEDTSNPVEYILSIDYKNRDYLGYIRHWENLKLATDDGKIWIKNFTIKQIESVEVKSIPYKQIFSVKTNKLFPYGSILPVKNLPSLLWSPIEIGLPLKLPKQNNNYFGLNEAVEIRIKPSDNIQEPCALLTSLETLNSYIQTAPSIRLKNLMWVILDRETLITGSPLLPLPGKTYWSRKNFLIPSGWDFEAYLLVDMLYKKMEQKNSWIVWDNDSSCKIIDKNNFVPLSISSFRLSTQKNNSS